LSCCQPLPYNFFQLFPLVYNLGNINVHAFVCQLFLNL
jgi:hypothetical protein